MHSRVFREDSLPELLDHQEIECRLRSDLNAALGRLNRVRAVMAAASIDTKVAVDSFPALSEEHAAALRELERASLRFADFVLKGFIPQDLQPAEPMRRSAANCDR